LKIFGYVGKKKTKNFAAPLSKTSGYSSYTYALTCLTAYTVHSAFMYYYCIENRSCAKRTCQPVSH
jgi:hypothetical protein